MVYNNMNYLAAETERALRPSNAKKQKRIYIQTRNAQLGEIKE